MASKTDAYEGVLDKGELDARTKLVAKRIKEAGVVIYAVQFGYRDATQEVLMKEIASGPGAPYYQFAPDAGALRTAFKEVGTNLSRLRLSR